MTYGLSHSQARDLEAARLRNQRVATADAQTRTRAMIAAWDAYEAAGVVKGALVDRLRASFDAAAVDQIDVMRLGQTGSTAPHIVPELLAFIALARIWRDQRCSVVKRVQAEVQLAGLAAMLRETWL